MANHVLNTWATGAVGGSANSATLVSLEAGDAIQNLGAGDVWITDAPSGDPSTNGVRLKANRSVATSVRGSGSRRMTATVDGTNIRVVAGLGELADIT